MEVTDDQLAGMDVTPELDQELAWILLNRTKEGSQARNLLRANQMRTGLEQLRQLNKDARSKGGAQETLTFQSLLHPAKAKGCEDFRRILTEWDTVLLEEEILADGGRC